MFAFNLRILLACFGAHADRQSRPGGGIYPPCLCRNEEAEKGLAIYRVYCFNEVKWIITI